MDNQHRETDLGRTLFELREEADLTQEQLSQKSGVSRVTISKLETGQIGTPRMGTLRRLAEALDVPVQSLLNPKKALAPASRYESGLAERFAEYEAQAKQIAAGEALPRTAPSLALALNEEVHWLDQREGTLPESVIQNYMLRALEIAQDTDDALKTKKRNLMWEIAEINEAEERLGEIVRDEGRARSAS